MFLITTADQLFWKTDRPVLFLGEWCKLYSKRNEWGRLDHEVLPYHWDDRKLLYQDYLYIDRLYEEVLDQICPVLNKLHNENHSIRYWRIVIGRWLNTFMAILYDRYLSIRSAEASGKVTGTLIGQYADGQCTPKNSLEFIKWFTGDAYNHYLYSRIIELKGSLNYEKREVRNFCGDGDRTEHASLSLKSVVKKILRICAGIVPASFNEIVFISSYMSRKDAYLLHLSLGQCPMFFDPLIEIPVSDIDLEKRKKIRINNNTNDEFKELLNHLIPEQIPQCYIESYSLLKDTAMREFPSNPRVIFTANAHVQNDGFKVWAASCVEDGALFCGTQHGGFEGIAQWFSTEDYQISIWDRYYSWGWKNVSKQNIKPLPSIKLNALKNIHKRANNGRILMVNTTVVRYSYDLCSAPVCSSGLNTYLHGIFKFIHSLDKKPQELLTIRLHPQDFQNYEKERFEQACPDIECYMGNKSMYKQLQESRLFIGNYNGTTYVEALVANIPSVIFWDCKQWELRDSAQPYFDKLRRAGIFHDTPESAADLVNRIYMDPLSWWQRSEIQEAKDQFCNQFALTSEHWLREWKDDFKKMLRLKRENEYGLLACKTGTEGRGMTDDRP